MEKELVQYLAAYDSLHFGALGTFYAHKYHAQADAADNIVFAPLSTIGLKENKDQVIDEEFIAHISKSLVISESQAKEHTEDYIENVLHNLNTDGKKKLNGFGILQKKGEQINFYADDELSLPILPAEKLIRENATHTLRVGDSEVSSEEMLAYYDDQGSSRNKGLYWLTGILILILTILVIVYYT